jgi:hypothetical protein
MQGLQCMEEAAGILHGATTSKPEACAKHLHYPSHGFWLAVIWSLCKQPCNVALTGLPLECFRVVQQAYVEAGRGITYACEPSVPIIATDAGSASSLAALRQILSNEAAAFIAASTIFSALWFLLPAANTCVCLKVGYQQHSLMH